MYTQSAYEERKTGRSRPYKIETVHVEKLCSKGILLSINTKKMFAIINPIVYDLLNYVCSRHTSRTSRVNFIACDVPFQPCANALSILVHNTISKKFCDINSVRLFLILIINGMNHSHTLFPCYVLTTATWKSNIKDGDFPLWDIKVELERLIRLLMCR
jgi:hypothetical protein